MKKTTVALAMALFFIVGVISSGQATTLTFDDVSALSEYAPDVTFSDNASIWTVTWADSVLTDPDGGAYSWPSALQFGNAGGEYGYAYFATPQSYVSVWALSGPGSDNLSAGMYIRGLDAFGNEISIDYVDSTVQFDLLSLSGADNIVTIEFWSPYVLNDVWDDLNFTSSVPEPATMLLLGSGLIGLVGARRKMKK